MITKEITQNIKNPISSSNDFIVIVLGCDQNYFSGLWVTLISLSMSTTTKKKILFYIFDGDISDNYKKKLENQITKLLDDFSIHWLNYNSESFKSFISMDGSFVQYSRLLIPEVLSESKCIWLDVDLIVLKDIEELWNTDMGEFPLAACLDYRCTFSEDISNHYEHNIPGNAPYYNSGVMLMELTSLKKTRFTTNTLRYLKEDFGSYKFHDQSAINVIFYDKIKNLSSEWNYQTVLSLRSYQKDVKIFSEKNKILHFIQKPKPWQKYSGRIPQKVFYHLAQISNYNLNNLNSIENFKEKFKWKLPRVFLIIYHLIFWFFPLKRKHRKIILNELNSISRYKRDFSKHQMVGLLNRIEKRYYSKCK